MSESRSPDNHEPAAGPPEGARGEATGGGSVASGDLADAQAAANGPAAAGPGQQPAGERASVGDAAAGGPTGGSFGGPGGGQATPGDGPAEGTEAGARGAVSGWSTPPGTRGRVLRRSRTDRKLAGVCGGLGAYTNTDPIIFRVLFAVFTLFGGFGLLLYGVAWLFIPDEGQDRSEAQQLFREGHTSAGALWAIAATVVGLLIFIAIAANEWDVVFWLLVCAGIAFVLLRSRTRPPHQVGRWWTVPPTNSPGDIGTVAAAPAHGRASTTGGEQASWTAPPEPASQSAEQTGWSVPSSQGAGPTPVAHEGPPAATYEPTNAAVPEPGVPAGPAATTGWRPRPEPAKPQRPGSPMPWLIVSAALVVGGAVGALDIAGVIDLGARGITAIILIVLGLGLLVTVWYGRARSVIALGIAAVAALVIVSAVDVPLSGGFGERHIEPVSAADLARDPVRLTAGKIVIDLTSYRQPAGSGTLEVSIGAGQIVVIYPSDIRLDATADVSAGNIETVGSSGLRVNGEDVVHEPVGTSRGNVQLNLEVGAGNVQFEEASRASS